MVLVDGALLLYAERGGRTVLTFSPDEAMLAEAGRALAATVTSGRIKGLTISRIDDIDAVAAAVPAVEALVAAGFAVTPRGLRLRGRHA